MTNMKVSCTAVAVWLCVICSIIMGCTRREQVPTLDEAIDALPDEWGPYSDRVEQVAKKFGYTVVNHASSTNNYAMLNRVIALTNVKERIRLTWKLYNHCRRTPEWYVEHLDGGYTKPYRLDFLGNCSWSLIAGTNITAETMMEGWKMEAETMRDLEAMIRLTGPEWQENMRKRAVERDMAKVAEWRAEMKRHKCGVGSLFHGPYSDELIFAEDIRLRYNFYFRSSSVGTTTYHRLPNDMKPAFLEFLKQNFYHCDGMTNVYMKGYPPELKEAYLEVRRQIEEK